MTAPEAPAPAGAIVRAAFFAGVRAAPFARPLGRGQVAGMSAILDEWEKRALADRRWLAYMLATVFHETARTMQPVREYGRGRGTRYGTTYYGRGFVQLTWAANYAAMGRLLGIPELATEPDRALELPVATAILFEGMLRGSFTGKKLADYFNARTDDPVGARRIINGTDRAALIAGYHRRFLAGLTATV